MATDPFAAMPTESPVAENGVYSEETTAVTAPTVAVVPTSDGKVVVTLKGGSSYDAPWIVIHADSVADAISQMDEQLFDLMQRAQVAAAKFAAESVKPAPAQAARSQTGAPAGATEAPGGVTRTCSHGEMIYRTGVKNGKTWQAHFCNTPQGATDKCAVQWIK